MDPQLLKVLKGLAEFKDMSLADLVAGIVLRALEGSTAISDDDTLHAVEQLRSIYKLRLAVADSHANPGP